MENQTRRNKGWASNGASLLIALMLPLSACAQADTGNQNKLTIQQQLLRERALDDGIGLYVDEGLRKSINALVTEGSSSALLDKALLNYGDGNYLGLFRSLHEYVAATGDLSRAYLYTSAYFIDRSYEEEAEYLKDLYNHPERYVEGETKYIKARMSEERISTDPSLRFLRISDDDEVTYEALVRQAKLGMGVDPNLLKKYWGKIQYNEAVIFDTILLIQGEYEAAYELFRRFKPEYKLGDPVDQVVVPAILFHSNQFKEFLDWYTFNGVSSNVYNEYYITSLWKVGRRDEALLVLQRMIEESWLRPQSLRHVGTVNYRPEFFNLLYFFYFRAPYEEFAQAGKVPEIEAWFQKRWDATTAKERRTFYRYGD